MRRQFQNLDDMKNRDLDSIPLAYIGDAVYEVDVRLHLLDKGITNTKHLQRESVKYVSAGAQAKAIKSIFDDLSEEEQRVVKRARNHKVATKAKNADIVTYKWATAFEALLGDLYISGRKERYDEIVTAAIDICGKKE